MFSVGLRAVVDRLSQGPVLFNLVPLPEASARGMGVIGRSFTVKDAAALTGVKLAFASGDIASARVKLELEA